MLTKLKLKRQDATSEYSYDVNRIVEIFAARDYEISPSDAFLAWEQFSDSMCAGWLHLDEDDEIVFNSVLNYFEELK